MPARTESLRSADSSLGRFYDPIVTEGWVTNRIGLYDKKTRRFYVIDFAEGSVSKGLQLAEGDSAGADCDSWRIRRRIVLYAVGHLREFAGDMECREGCVGATRSVFARRDKSSQGYDFADWDWTYTYIPVLDKTGRIYIYNTKEQSLTQVGYLPMPQSLFIRERRNEIARPRDVLAYWIQPVYCVFEVACRRQKTPGGLLMRNILGWALLVFREKVWRWQWLFLTRMGSMIYRGDTNKW